MICYADFASQLGTDILDNSFVKHPCYIYMSISGTVLLWHQSFGGTPIVKQLPWLQREQIESMCHDPSGVWLLCASRNNKLYVVPALAILVG